ncbi:hypothetical protein Tco_0120542, partial [Tanacetum coccineum]
IGDSVQPSQLSKVLQATLPSPRNERDFKDRNVGKLLNGRFSQTSNDKEGDLWIMGYRSQMRWSAQLERKRSGKVIVRQCSASCHTAPRRKHEA